MTDDAALRDDLIARILAHWSHRSDHPDMRARRLEWPLEALREERQMLDDAKAALQRRRTRLAALRAAGELEI